jgi:hypothetical protein
LFSNSRRGSDSASGDQQVGPKAKWPFGRFKTIQDVVKLFEVRGLEEVTNLDHPGVQKKCNAWLMYDEWLSLGSEQKKWDDKFTSKGRILSKTDICKFIRESK